eukprot:758843-Hanusia_phi.AAC.3
MLSKLPTAAFAPTVTPVLPGSHVSSATAPTVLRMSYRPAQDAGDLPDAGWGGEKKAHTRDPKPTRLDPTDPKAKQTYVPPAESFEEYLKRRNSGGKSSKTAQTYVAPISGSSFSAGSGVVDLKSVKSSRSDASADSKPSLFEEYMKKRQGVTAQPTYSTVAESSSFKGTPAQDAGDLPDAGW